MTGGPPQALGISAEQCAGGARGFDRGAPLVFPGRPYWLLTHLLPLLPRRAQRLQTARAARQLRAYGCARYAGPCERAGSNRNDNSVRVSRLVLTGTAVGTILGTGRADLRVRAFRGSARSGAAGG